MSENKGKNFAGSSWVSPQANERLNRLFKYSWSASVDNRTGDVRIRLVETDLANVTKTNRAENEHTWVFPKWVIITYLEQHPLNVYDHPFRENMLREAIDRIILPLEQNGPKVIQRDRYTPETVFSIYHNTELKTVEFHTSAELATLSNKDVQAGVRVIDTVDVTIDDDITPVYRNAIRRAAWYYALIAAFKNCRYDDFYGSGDNNILKMLRGQPRFLDLVPNSGEKPVAV